MSNLRVIYQNATGGCSILIPADKAIRQLEEQIKTFNKISSDKQADFSEFAIVDIIAKQSIPTEIPYQIVPVEVIPADRTYRNSWELQENQIVHNLEKAKEIHKEFIRQARKPLLESLDIAYIRASEENDAEKILEVAKAKKLLRDATNNPAISAATSIEELKQAWLPELGANPVISKEKGDNGTSIKRVTP